MDNFNSVNSFFYNLEQIAKLKTTRIGIAGAGGIGSNCAHVLVRCGLVNFVLADFDQVSISNLNRQNYTPNDLGKNKVDCLKNFLLRINPELNITTHVCKIEKNNVHTIYGDCDIVVEAFDNPDYKSMIVEEFIGTEKFLVAVSGIGGYGNSDRIVTRKIRSNFYLIGDGLSEVGESVKPYAPTVMIAAAKQADCILNHVLSLP
ncbi:MAG: sulfur carrier protein ThiS adenylyltransferase ThiF [Fibrobacter sp.]|nr:sulfur carrier protein ThiS adenylyltransferase ThiF [Fibrobacter sp.]